MGQNKSKNNLKPSGIGGALNAAVVVAVNLALVDTQNLALVDDLNSASVYDAPDDASIAVAPPDTLGLFAIV